MNEQRTEQTKEIKHLERLVGFGPRQVRHDIVGFQRVHHHFAGLFVAGGTWNNCRPGIGVRIVGRICKTLRKERSVIDLFIDNVCR